MHLRRLTPWALFVAISVSSLFATSAVPRKSPEFTIVEASGKVTPLSTLKGRVVVIEFLLTNCPHCMRVAQTITKLYAELGAQGFQPIGIAFDKSVDGKRTADFSQLLGINFPVGYCTSETVDNYLGRKPAERLMVPQLVVIDRQGVIRAQSRPIGEPNLENADYLRNLIETLLRESGGQHH